MSPQVAIASHACAHLGAVQVPIFSGFAAPAIAARLADAKAKALITADGSLRRGQLVADEADRRRGARVGSDGHAHRRLAASRARGRADDTRARPLLGRARRQHVRRPDPEAGRFRTSLPPRIHIGDDRKAEGRATRPGRLPRVDRARGCVPDERQARRSHPLRHGHGLDHGPVDGGRRRRVRRDRGLRGRSAGLSGRPHLEADRVRARDDARRFPDARARADPEGRPASRHVHVEGDLHDRRTVEPRSVPLVVREGRRRQRRRS